MPRTICCDCGGPKDGASKSYCKACMALRSKAYYHTNPGARERQSAWLKANPEKRRTYKRRWNMKKLGLVGELEEHLERQDHKCAICLDPLRMGTGGFAVDHDHATGVVREILCGRCNFLLGNARDSQFILSQAIAYLRRNSRKVS